MLTIGVFQIGFEGIVVGFDGNWVGLIRFEIEEKLGFQNGENNV